MSAIWFCGDPHGKLDYLVRAVLAQKPNAIVLLGDVECAIPLPVLVRSILPVCEVWYIPGNHDADEQRYWDNLHALQGRSLHAQAKLVAGVEIAGLGGTFDRKVWHPHALSGSAQNRDEYLLQIDQRRVHPEAKENMAMISQGFIYPDDYFCTAMLSAEILVTHEAPSCHRHGFVEIDELARSVGARKVFHGHHHESYREGNVFGVGFRQIVDQDGREIQV
ncbi:putative phosphodiesterase [Pseudomonas nitritireducens]|uniref:Putative phosphodiesterase n=1 Tax=Pseudomonas nitroreducens TaxID=46680 RepID=A0A7W7P3P2_PSENT|nr:metallophosphoesterase [Pseudomonas nitritireducens]MBB4867203.1 putative phosphodiesterase [Pseudomonas nitritireducens]